MTLPVHPNPISIDDLRTEFSVSGTKSLQDFYAGAGIVPNGTVGFPLGGGSTVIPSSGEISLNNFQGASAVIPPFTTTISTNQQELFLRDYVVGLGWNQSSPVEVTINEGVWITGGTLEGTQAALYIWGSWPNGLTVYLNGIVAGRGGRGGFATIINYPFGMGGDFGQNAISIATVGANSTVQIVMGANSAIMAGGGGGAAMATNTDYEFGSGGGGGAGGGIGGAGLAVQSTDWSFTVDGINAPTTGYIGNTRTRQYVKNNILGTITVGGGASGGWVLPNQAQAFYSLGGNQTGNTSPQAGSPAAQSGGGGGGYTKSHPDESITVKGADGGLTYRKSTIDANPPGNLVSTVGSDSYSEALNIGVTNPTSGGGGGGGWGRKGGNSYSTVDGVNYTITYGGSAGRAIRISSGGVTLSGVGRFNYLGSIQYG